MTIPSFPILENVHVTCEIEWTTSVLSNDNGTEQRVLEKAHPIRRYSLYKPILTVSDLSALRVFFAAIQGSTLPFYYTDKSDSHADSYQYNYSTLTPIGVNVYAHGELSNIDDGMGGRAQYECTKVYYVNGVVYRRPVSNVRNFNLPSLSSLGGITISSVVDSTVTFSSAIAFSPSSRDLVSCSFDFDVLVRIEGGKLSDKIVSHYNNGNLIYSLDNLTFVEVLKTYPTVNVALFPFSSTNDPHPTLPSPGTDSLNHVLETDLRWGQISEAGYQTEIIDTGNAIEARRLRQVAPEYYVSLQNKKIVPQRDLSYLIALFYAAHGRAFAFSYSEPVSGNTYLCRFHNKIFKYINQTGNTAGQNNFIYQVEGLQLKLFKDGEFTETGLQLVQQYQLQVTLHERWRSFFTKVLLADIWRTYQTKCTVLNPVQGTLTYPIEAVISVTCPNGTDLNDQANWSYVASAHSFQNSDLAYVTAKLSNNAVLSGGVYTGSVYSQYYNNYLVDVNAGSNNLGANGTDNLVSEVTYVGLPFSNTIGTQCECNISEGYLVGLVPIGNPAYQASGFATTLAWCQVLRITTTSGTIYTFTSHDRNLWIGGELYRASTAIAPSAYRSNAALQLDSVEFGSVFIYLDEDLLLSGIFQEAKIQTGIVDWSSLPPDIKVATDYQEGIVGKITSKGFSYSFEFLSAPSNALNQNYAAKTTSACPYKFGDPNTCRATPNVWTTTVIAVQDPNSVTIGSGVVSQPHQLRSGTCEFLTGSLEGQIFSINELTGGDRVVFNTFFKKTPSIGDTIKLTAGCLKTLAACQDYNNVLNYGGIPTGGNWMPGSYYFLNPPKD